ncbi:hypothetical protein BGZ75_003955 [Mortierella antarctica]|nr:hypothetical protein BGZ75_003955 [Mortierella antarctica]
MAVTGNVWLDFVVGFVVSLIGSIMNAAGLNLLKLDHVRNSARIQERQRHECGRPLWHVGLYLYVGSQLLVSTIALNFLKTQWVAPLGSIALIFNFVFAKILVGTRITKRDVWGTVVVMISVVWIVVFGGMNSGADNEDSLTIAQLKELFSRVVFIIFFSVLNLIVFALLALGLYAYWAISLDDESGQLRKKMKTKLTKLLGTNRLAKASGLTLASDEGLEAEAKDLRLRKVVAMIMATTGGLIASQTLLLAKSGVKLITSTAAGQNQFKDSMSFFILFVLVITAVLQVYCLNTALKLYDSVLVVPLFYGFYTAFGLINSTIYLNQLQYYQPWVLLLILIGIGVLIFGVRMLSDPKTEQEESNITGAPASAARDAVFNDEDDKEGSPHQQQKSANKLGGSKEEFRDAGKREKTSGLGSLTSSDEMIVSDGGPRFSIKLGRQKSLQLRKKGEFLSEDNVEDEGHEEGDDVLPPMFMANRRKQVDSDQMDDDDTVGFSSATTMRREGVIVQNTIIMATYQQTEMGVGGGSSLSAAHIPDLHNKPRAGSDMQIQESKERDAKLQRKQSLPSRIDTGVAVLSSVLTRGRSETRKARRSTPMSPSEFRAQYTDSPLPVKPKHLQEGARGLGEGYCSRSSSPGLVPAKASSEITTTRSRAHSTAVS